VFIAHPLAFAAAASDSRHVTRRAFHIFKVLGLTLLLALPVKTAAQEITVFAAASLRDILENAALDHQGDVRFSFAGSGTIARQVAAGAPADLVILAHVQWRDWLSNRMSGLNWSNLASNRLVVIGPKGAETLSTDGLIAALGSGRLALGQTDSVPAGLYAKQWLTARGLWKTLEHKLAETENVRTALALVARGEAPLGIVYQSDATADASVDVVMQIDPSDHDKISYPAAALTEDGAAFLHHLKSSGSRAIWAEHGFIPAHEAPE